MTVELSPEYRPGYGRPVDAGGKKTVALYLELRKSERELLYKRAREAGNLEATPYLRTLIRAAAAS